MGVFTNFLKLLKPNPDDFYDVTTQQAENWQKVDDWAKRIDDGKLDAGAVSAEYNTGEKIEDKIKAVQETADNKLDKGAYVGNAQDLKDEIDQKQNKQDNTLETTAKEIVLAINESLWNVKPKQLTSTINIDNLLKCGLYYTDDVAVQGTFPQSLYNDRRWYLLVLSRDTAGQNTLINQILFDNMKNSIFYRTTSNTGQWTNWVEALNSDSKLFLGTCGVDEVKHIQDKIIKIKGKGYYDETTGKLYICIKEANATIITPNSEYFTPADNISLSNISQTAYYELQADERVLPQKNVKTWSKVYDNIGITYSNGVFVLPDSGKYKITCNVFISNKLGEHYRDLRGALYNGNESLPMYVTHEYCSTGAVVGTTQNVLQIEDVAGSMSCVKFNKAQIALRLIKNNVQQPSTFLAHSTNILFEKIN